MIIKNYKSRVHKKNIWYKIYNRKNMKIIKPKIKNKVGKI